MTGPTGPTGATGATGPTGTGGGGLFDAFAFIRDEKSASTQGGSSSSGAWNTRDLNTEVLDANGIVSISSNQFTLAAGTYVIRARAPFTSSSVCQIRLYNITDSVEEAYGSTTYTTTTDQGNADSFLFCEVVADTSTVYEIQYYCHLSRATNGLGTALNHTTNNVFTEVEIWRRSS